MTSIELGQILSGKHSAEVVRAVRQSTNAPCFGLRRERYKS
jgi:hypothetical protein